MARSWKLEPVRVLTPLAALLAVGASRAQATPMPIDGGQRARTFDGIGAISGVEFCLADQAEARNRDIGLYGLAWAAPGWINGGFRSADTINYLISSLDCAEQHDLAAESNDYNDDVLWAGLAFARGYEITGNGTYLNQAEYAFNRVYNRGWDGALGGGIWWSVKKQEKSAVSNSPAVILGVLVYESTGDHGLNLTWNRWDTQTPRDDTSTIEAVGAVIMQAVTPASEPTGTTNALVSMGNNKCIEVPNLNHSDGQRLDAWTCDNGADQHWRFVNGTLRTQNDLCVAVAGSCTVSGATIQIAACSGNPAQPAMEKPVALQNPSQRC